MQTRLLTLALLAVLAIGCRGIPLDRDLIPPEQTRNALQSITESTALNAAVEEACRRTVEAHQPALADMDHIQATVIDITQPALPLSGHWNGDEQVYPASVIKTVFMVHTFEQAAHGRLALDRHLRNLLKRMIRVSENIATQHVVDILSGVREGPRIDQDAAYRSWVDRRNATNRYARSLGFTRMNANQKTWDELPDDDSVELQFLGGPHAMGYENGNRLTTNDIARLMWLIDQDRVVSPGACRAMRRLLERRGHWWRRGDERRPIGDAMPRGTCEWSKGGSTSRFRHDTATLALPDGRRYVFAVFTEVRFPEDFEGEGDPRSEILDFWARAMLDAMP